MVEMARTAVIRYGLEAVWQYTSSGTDPGATVAVVMTLDRDSYQLLNWMYEVEVYCERLASVSYIALLRQSWGYLKGRRASYIHFYATVTFSRRRSCNLSLVGCETSPSDGPGFEGSDVSSVTTHP